MRIRKEKEEVLDEIYSLIQFKINKEDQKEYGIVTMKHSWARGEGETK